MTKYGDVREALAQAQLETARDLLRDYLEAEPDSAEVWYLASKAAVNDKQKRYFLEKAVECDPLHTAAGLELHALTNGKQASPALSSQPQAQTTAQPAIVPAPFLNRALALLIDAGVLYFMTLLLSWIALLLTGAANNPQALSQHYLVWMLMNSVFYMGYFGYSYAELQGQTLGKRFMNIRVIKRNGEPLGWPDAFLRCWVGYLLSAAPLGLGFLWALVDKQKRAWHDIIADTLVVKA